MNSNNQPKDNQDQNIKPTLHPKTNVLAIASLVAAFFIPIVGLILSIVALNQIKKTSENGRSAAIAGLVISILVMIFHISLIILMYLIIASAPKEPVKVKTNQNTTTQSQQQSTQTPTEKELSYEIVNENKKGTTNRVTVYTTETTDDRLTKLNDKLLEQYKSGMTHLYIDYFNDKAVASTYFEKQADPGISEVEKDQLYTHYIANMVYNTTTGFKTLQRSVPHKILKTY